MSKLGSKINKHRKEKKLTLERLAQLSGISKSYLWELENKASKSPSAEILERIANNLGVTTSYLLNDTSSELKEDESDMAFFRNYQQMDAEQKQQLQQIMDVLKKQG